MRKHSAKKISASHHLLSRRETIGLFGIAIILALLLYVRVMHGTYVFDDAFFSERMDLGSFGAFLKIWTQPYLPQNPIAGMYRPLPIASYVFTNALLGNTPFMHHIVSIVLHGIISALVVMFVRQMSGNRSLALLTGLLFLVLPIHTEAVAYLKARDEILEMLCALLSWISGVAAIASDRLNMRLLWVSALAFLGALLCKEFAIIVPVVVFMLYVLKTKDWKTMSLTRLAVPYATALAFYLVLRSIALGPGAFTGAENLSWTMNPLTDATFPTRILTGLSIAVIAIGKSIIPWKLSATYSFNAIPIVLSPLQSWMPLIGLLLLLALLTLALHRRTRSMPVGIGAAFFLIAYLPMSKFLFAKKMDMFGERWMYLPSLGLCVVIAAFLLMLLRRRKNLGIAVTSALLLFYAGVTIVRAAVWQSPESLYQSMTVSAPDAVVGWTNLAQLSMARHDFETAKDQITRGLQITEYHPPLLQLVGLLAMGNRQYDIAEQAFQASQMLAPDDDLPYLYLGIIAAERGEYQAGLSTIFSRFHSFDSPPVRFVLSLLFFRMGQESEAETYMDWDTSDPEMRRIFLLPPVTTMEERRAILRGF